MKNHIGIVQDIFKQTTEGTIKWSGTSSDSCFNSQYKNRGIVICKYYPYDDDNLISSLSYLDDDGMLSDERYTWKEGQPEFEELSKLYDFLAKHYHEQFEKE